MPILLIVIIAIFIVAYVFSLHARTAITTAAQTAGYLVQGAWASRPTFGTVMRWASIPLGILFLPYVIFFAIFMGLGIALDAPLAGMLIGLLGPFWFLLFVLKPIKGFFGRVNVIPFWLTTIILIICTYAIIPDYYYIRYIGIDPADYQVTSVEKAYRKFEKAQRARMNEPMKKNFDDMTRDMEKGSHISPERFQVANEYKRKLDSRPLLGPNYSPYESTTDPNRSVMDNYQKPASAPKPLSTDYDSPGKQLITEKSFTFNQPGLQTLATNVSRDRYLIVATGTYGQVAYGSEGIRKIIHVPVTGMKGSYTYANLPLPNTNFGAVILDAGEGLQYVGNRLEFTADSSTVRVGINIPADNPSNFAGNSGSIRISLYKIS